MNELDKWFDSMELNGKFEHDLVSLLFEHYLRLGYSIQEAQTFTEMDYMEYKKYPAIFLLKRINVKDKNFTAAEPMEEKNNG